MKSEVNFAEIKLKKAFDSLLKSKSEDKLLHKWISRAIDDLEENAFCGTAVPKHLIPRTYITKYQIDNLWKYDLPKGWRLLYSVANDEIKVVSIILEWMDHKNYERRFKY